MQTKNLIQSSATVIRIINLKAGDIYKRYSESSYDSSCYYGIVKRVSNNGEKTFIEAVEYKKSYSTIEADFRVFGGDKDLDIFPATLSEIQEEFGNVVEKLHKEINELNEKVIAKQKCIQETEMLLTGELQKQLQIADFKEMTQQEYESLKQERSKLLEI